MAGHWSVPALLLLAVTTVGLAAPLAPLGPPAGHVEDEVRPGHPGTSRGAEGTVCSGSVAGVAVRQVGLWDLVLSTQRPVQEATALHNLSEKNKAKCLLDAVETPLSLLRYRLQKPS